MQREIKYDMEKRVSDKKLITKLLVIHSLVVLAIGKPSATRTYISEKNDTWTNS